MKMFSLDILHVILAFIDAKFKTAQLRKYNLIKDTLQKIHLKTIILSKR